MTLRFPHLYSPVTIGSMTLKNRLVRSATYEAKADEKGNPTESYLEYYRRLASGGVGLIVSGLAYPDATGKLPKALRVDDESCVYQLRRVPRAIHETGNGCKVALQIGHTGRQLPQTLNRQTLAPSPIREPLTGRMPRELKPHEIEVFIERCAAAVMYAQQAGFDAVQVHAAHGWLLSSFLSPNTNHRSDAYGGSLESRAHILVEIIRCAKKRVDADYPVLLKMNACDYVEAGLDLPEALRLGTLFAQAGYAALEVSSGMWETITRDPDIIGWKAERIPEARKRIKTIEDEAYHRDFARAFKEQIPGVKIILVGGLKTPALMEEIIAAQDADLVALSRALIREPDLPNRWAASGTERAACISCNKCLDTLKEVHGLRCACVR